VLGEITFKVFPRAAATRTLRLVAGDAAAMGAIFSAAGNSRWEIDALEASPEEGAVYVRLAGPGTALDAIATEILGRHSGAVLPAAEAMAFWSRVVELGWAQSDGVLVKVALTPDQVADFVAFVRPLSGARSWLSAGGNAGFLSLPANAPLPQLRWPAMTLRGNAPLWPGVRPRFEVMGAVKAALDPNHRFPGLDD
jgi:glycolate oxidase FAD binding subunit